LAVSGDIVGRPVNAVLVPPQAERFASLVGVDPGRLVGTFDEHLAHL
jgi:hypothetical protein